MSCSAGSTQTCWAGVSQHHSRQYWHRMDIAIWQVRTGAQCKRQYRVPMHVWVSILLAIHSVRRAQHASTQLFEDNIHVLCFALLQSTANDFRYPACFLGAVGFTSPYSTFCTSAQHTFPEIDNKQIHDTHVYRTGLLGLDISWRALCWIIFVRHCHTFWLLQHLISSLR